MTAPMPVSFSLTCGAVVRRCLFGDMGHTIYAVAGAIAVVAGVVVARRWARRSGARALLRHRARVDRFKLASRAHVRAQLLDDPEIHAAIREHALETGESEEHAARRVRGYVDEIVPFFN